MDVIQLAQLADMASCDGDVTHRGWERSGKRRPSPAPLTHRAHHRATTDASSNRGPGVQVKVTSYIFASCLGHIFELIRVGRFEGREGVG